MSERVVLITNLLDVAIETGFGQVKTHTNALVLSDRGPKDGTGARYRMHGFRNEAANPTFDLVLPSFDWSIEPQAYRRKFALCFGNAAPAIELYTDFANDLPLDIERFEGEAATRGWDETLVRKVLRYYHAPYFVLGQQLETKRARQALGVEGAVEV